MSATQIQRLNQFHEEFARWTLENPAATLADASARFGYTITWLSIIANSDAFRARLAELNSAADSMVIADVPARLRGLATRALDKLGEQIEEVISEGPMARVDRDFTRETAEMALKALGYGAKPQQGAGTPPLPSSGGTVIYADKVLVQSARERILQRGRVIDNDAAREIQVEQQALEVRSGT